MDEGILYLPVTELAARIRAKTLSPVELTQAYLDRIAKHAHRFNAFATVTADLALQQAKKAEDEIRGDRYRGSLHGIPFAVKDLLATSGIPTTWGAKPYEHQVFDYDATVVRLLREVGAVLLGKLSMVELAGGLGYHIADASLQGPGRNPWNPDHWTGGSSSGPGAAMAAGLAAFTIGSETWGSIVCPSSFCGVTGMRPSYGRVSRFGAMPLSWTMDKLGPMCRTAADCRIVLAAISGPDPQDITTSGMPVNYAPGLEAPARKMRLGYVPLDFTKHGEKEVDKAVRAAVAELKAAGYDVEEATLPEGPWEEAALCIIEVEAVSSFEELYRNGKVKLLTDRKAPQQQQVADVIRGRDYVKALRMRTALQWKMQEVFSKYDALVSPGMLYESTPIPADLNVAMAGSDPLGAIGNLCGLPAACVPCGTGAKGLPVGMVIVGPAFAEDEVLQIAQTYQTRTAWWSKHPKLS